MSDDFRGARVRPFRALVFDPAVAGDMQTLVAPPYDVIGPEYRDELASRNEWNVVGIDLPSIPYDTVAATIADWTAQGVLKRHDEPVMIAWTQEFDLPDGSHRTRKTIVAVVGAEPYETRVVRPHERTHAGPKEERLRLMNATKVQLSPVFGLYPDPAGEAWAAAAVSGEPDAVITDDDGTVHRLWTITDPGRLAAIEQALAGRWILIADGHHRYETGLAYLGERESTGDPGEATGIMAFVVELADDQLEVRGIHRIVTLPEGTDPAAALAPWFDVLPTGPVDQEVRRRMVDAGALCLVTRRGTSLLCPKAGAFGPEIDLDSQRIRIALEAIPGSGVRYHHDVATVCGAVDDGSASAGVLLRPATVAQIQAVAHARTRMPAKTTFFWPKPRTGVLFRPVD